MESILAQHFAAVAELHHVDGDVVGTPATEPLSTMWQWPKKMCRICSGASR